MGTNYYIYTTAEDETKDPERLHIGKSSSGWVFSMRIYPERGINTLYDWLPIILDSSNIIRNEYGSRITTDDLLHNITVRSRNDPVNWSEAEFYTNHAEPGPNNLVRHRQMTEYGRTVTHGEGTWDYMDYEFF
jgi:hypothetical protein